MNQKGSMPILLLLAAVGLLIYLFATNTFSFKDKLFLLLYPKPPSHAAALPIVFKSSAGEILPTNASGIPLTTSAEIKIELTSSVGIGTTESVGIGTTESVGIGTTESVGIGTTGVEITTTFYRIAENPTDLDDAEYVAYAEEPTVIDYTFKNTSLGSKVIWADFKDLTDQIDRKAAQIELISAQATPTPGPTLTSTPTPRPTLNPTPTPIQRLLPTSTSTPTPKPVPLKSPTPAPTLNPTPTLTATTTYKSALELIKERNSSKITFKYYPTLTPSPVLKSNDCGVFCNLGYFIKGINSDISNGINSFFEDILKRLGILTVQSPGNLRF